MMITHNFRSGNSCDIYIPDRIKVGAFNEAKVEWDDYPPSPADLKEYLEEVYRTRVLPRLEAVMCESYGPGHMVEIMPGVRGRMATNFRQEKHS